MPKYLFEQDGLTCISLEKLLGLQRGDIASIASDGVSVEVESRNGLTLTQGQQAQMRAAFESRGMIRGKRRDMGMAERPL